MDPIGRTSRFVAAARAKEHQRPDRLFSDPYAEALAGREGMRFLEEAEAATPGNPIVPVRTRYFDDAIREAVASPDLRQLVFLAAGMDCRCYRLSWPEGMRCFELDREAVLEHKSSLLTSLGAKPGCERHALSCDLREDFGAALKARGFDPARRTFWLVEGILEYFEDAQVEDLLSRLARLSPAGSIACGNVFRKAALANPNHPWIRLLQEDGAVLRFGTDDPVGLFARCGWRVEIVDPREHGAKLGRPWGAGATAPMSMFFRAVRT